jgi:hypothetical protein
VANGVQVITVYRRAIGLNFSLLSVFGIDLGYDAMVAHGLAVCS